MPAPTTHSPLHRLGAILEFLRKQRGQDLAALAQKSGVSIAILQEVEESNGVPPLHLRHLDTILTHCNLSLGDLARGERRLITGEDPRADAKESEVDALLRTIEGLQDHVESLEGKIAQRNSATIRAFQMQTITLLERTMETSGMSREAMRQLVSDLEIEDVE